MDKEILHWQGSDWESGEFSPSLISVPAEKPVELIVNGRLLAVLHCTPADLEDLAAGFLLGQGLIASYEEIKGWETDRMQSQISLKLANPLMDDAKAGLKRTVIYSGCVQGQLSAAGLSDLIASEDKAIAIKSRFDAPVVGAALAKLLKSGEIYRRTRGIHSAAVCSTKGKILAMREDIGRHNALDKVLGWTARHGADPERLFVVASGRISSEAVVKIIRFGIPLLATRGVPTSLALSMAEKKGITLAGSLGPGKLRFYTYQERLK